MLNGFDASLEDRLKMAEQAEMELTRLQPLASEAPNLRAEKAKAHRTAERKRAKDSAMSQAQDALHIAVEKQHRVPELLGTAGRAINEFFSTLKEIESRRQDAMQALALADRVDYEMELEVGEEHERSLDRDPRGLAYALAGRHGDGRVKKLLEDMHPGFGLLAGCNMDDPLFRDVANFVMQRVTPATPPVAASANTMKKNHEKPREIPEITDAPVPDPASAIPAFLSDSDQE